MSAPSPAFGLVWVVKGLRQTHRGPRVLCVAEGTPLFHAAYDVCREPLRDVGFGLDRENNSRAAYWHRLDCDPHVVLSVVAEATVAGRAELVRREEERNRRQAEIAALIEHAATQLAASREDARRRLADLIRGARRWSVHPSVRDEAIALTRQEALDAVETERALLIVKRAGDTVERAHARAEREARDDGDRARARDPEVRKAALRACRVITAQDDDWAADRNDIGWSKSTTLLGHALAEKKTLSRKATANALAILRIHRGQVAVDLHALLFGA